MGRHACIAGVVGAFGLAALSAALAAPGQLDSGFGTGGTVITNVGGADWAAAVAVAPNGRVVVAGGSGGDVALARYDAAGRLDAHFGGGRGIVITDLGGDDAADALVVQPDGKIVIAGQRSGDLALARYSADGTLDPSFDGDGIVVTDLGGRERAFGLLRRPDGRLVVVGATSDRLMLARYLRDGRLDPGFGRRGTVITRTPGLDWRMATLGRDGTIVVAGALVITRPAQATALAHAMALAVARYRPDGRLDRTFAGDGLTVTSARRHWAGAVKVAVRRDGRIVLGTHGHAGDRAGFALVRLRRNGSLDRSFGDDGVAVSEIGYGVHALGLDRRGRIVAVGRTMSLLDFVAARFLPDGRRDGSFAATVTDFGGVDTPFALAIQPDGKIVAAGASAGPGTSLVGDIAVARYLSSG
jgi:uncharacterized delta-60 repeat protein